MAKEIERRFLINMEQKNFIFGTLIRKCVKKINIKQKYVKKATLELGETQDVRIRLQNHEALLTIKMFGSKDGIDEFEYLIPYDEGVMIFDGIKHKPIEKTRYIIMSEDNKYKFELDVFKRQNKGLIVVEVEFPSIEESNNFVPPLWFGKEITKNQRLSNRTLYSLSYNYGI